MLDLDVSLFVVFALVWLLMMVLDRLFFRPVGRIIDERETRGRRDSEKLAALLAETEKKTLAVETRLREARRHAALAREEWVRRGEAARAAMAESARTEAARKLEAGMARLDGDIAAAEARLRLDVASFSDQIRRAFL